MGKKPPSSVVAEPAKVIDVWLFVGLVGLVSWVCDVSHVSLMPPDAVAPYVPVCASTEAFQLIVLGVYIATITLFCASRPTTSVPGVAGLSGSPRMMSSLTRPDR